MLTGKVDKVISEELLSAEDKLLWIDKVGDRVNLFHL